MLDLHSNKINKIENINHLSELRVLNLANNLITTVSNLNGLVSLTELNLRRKLDNVTCVKECSQLSELALDGNPIYGKKGYMEFCLNNCPNLK